MSKNNKSGVKPPLYALQGVTKRYGQGEAQVAALRGIDLEIHHGQFVVIAGPSGSGKSTLLQLLGGLDRASSGEVCFEGADLGRLGDTDLARLRLETFGFVFQQFNLIPTLTAIENVEVPLAPSRLSGEERRERAEELLMRMGLGSRRTHLPSQLSGGEQQRVAIARALTHAPRVILADEPTGNLDSSTGAEVLDLLWEVSAEQAQTLVLITHEEAIAAEAPVVLRMQDGQLAEPESNLVRPRLGIER